MIDEHRTSNPINCGHLRVYHSIGLHPYREYEERKGSCLFCDVERLTAELAHAQAVADGYLQGRTELLAERDRLQYLVRHHQQFREESERLRAALRDVGGLLVAQRYIEAAHLIELATGAADETSEVQIPESCPTCGGSL